MIAGTAFVGADGRETAVRSRPDARSCAIPQFVFHLCDGVDHILDPEGIALPDMDAVKREALRAARDVTAHGVMDGKPDLDLRIDVADEAGTIVYSLAFRDALQIIPPDEGPAFPNACSARSQRIAAEMEISGIKIS